MNSEQRHQLPLFGEEETATTEHTTRSHPRRAAAAPSGGGDARGPRRRDRTFVPRSRDAPAGDAARNAYALITIEEAAEMLGVGRTTMYRVLKEGQIPLVHIGRCSRVVRSDVDDYIERLRREAHDRRNNLRSTQRPLV